MRRCALTGSSELTGNVQSLLISYLNDRKFSGTHLEIGTAAGGTLKKLMLSYESHQRPKFVVIDPMTYFPNQFNIVKNNLLEAGIDPREVMFYVTKSAKAFKEISRSKESFDFIFIDGAHKIKQVWQDLLFTSMLSPGGLLCIDDYADVPQVQIPVDRFLRNNKNYQVLALEERTLFVEKVSSVKNKLDYFGSLEMLFVNLFYQWRESFKKRFGKRR